MSVAGTVAFWLLFGTSWLVVLAIAAPFFVQFIFFDDPSLRIWSFTVAGFPFLLLVVAIILCWGQRRYRLTSRMERIPHVDLPKTVNRTVQLEYSRASAIVYATRPSGASHPGWSNGIAFRPTILGQVMELDSIVRQLYPNTPAMKPHTRMATHFRMARESTALGTFDAAVQLARYASRELEEFEFVAGMQAVDDLKQMFIEGARGRSYESE